MPDPPAIPASIGGGHGGGPKKKFGKNLNRLLVPAATRAPPPPTAIARLSSRTPTKGSGLAFLSSKTKLSSSAKAGAAVGSGAGNGAGAGAGASGGGGGGRDGGGSANGPSAPPVLMVAPEPTSVHDALLTAAAAEAGLVAYPRAEEREVDAWGTVQQSKEQRELKERAAERQARAQQQQQQQQQEEEEERRQTRLRLAEERKRELMERRRQREEVMAKDLETDATAGPSSAGPRPADPQQPNDTAAEAMASQPDAMARLARERAAARKAEEEERFRLQREGAARRLRELEEKMGASGAGGNAATGGGGSGGNSSSGRAAVDPTEVQNWRQRSRPQQLGTQIKLERLGGGGADAGRNGTAAAAAAGGGSTPKSKSIMAAAAAARKASGGLASSPSSRTRGGDALAGRSLWDPNQGRTFSSLVGGSATGVVATAEDIGGAGAAGAGAGAGALEEHPVSPLKDYDDSFDRGDGRGGGGRGGRMVVDVDEYRRGSSGRRGGGDRRRADSNAGSSDRGRSNSNVSDYGRYAYEVGPPEMDRLIHVADYETTDRGEGVRKAEAPRLLFDPTTGSMVEAKDIPPEKKAKKSKKERKSRAAADGGPLLLRRPEDNDDGGKSAARKGSKKEKTKRGDDAKGVKKGSRSRSQPKLPRTCGVLYRRDDRGRFVCADGCDADQGYGAHSVPGGKIRNPAGHAAFVKEQKRVQQEAAAYRASPRGDGGYFANGGYQQGDDYGQDYMGGYDGYGGYGDAVASKEEELVAPEVALVKADEDLKLMVGEDSPTLKPSAREFAPSQAALAAASSAPAASAKNQKSGDDAKAKSNSNTFAALYCDDDEEEEDTADEDHAIGLGFDPTQNMDAVMMSPAGSPSKGKVEIEAEPFELAMGQMTVVETEDVDGSPRMPFSGRRGKSEASRLLGNVAAAWSLSEPGGAEEATDGGNAAFTTAFGDWKLTSDGGEDGDDKMPASFLNLEQFGSSEDLVGIGGILDDLDTDKEEEDG
eukprot:CAMPEP_0181061902 /NCGR_PEP_ID=MMETSP1070-20121207/22782_1 /TAXON_ID=265543 /ORGANISM="Minutocellus polymorphus, Strain NH13" /LENGTH=993 /DNA_ID=CAMNT_0023141915 /DNA_START=154 /DNA_END=3135 /DNA_ORIENTATION=-